MFVRELFFSWFDAICSFGDFKKIEVNLILWKNFIIFYSISIGEPSELDEEENSWVEGEKYSEWTAKERSKSIFQGQIKENYFLVILLICLYDGEMIQKMS